MDIPSGIKPLPCRWIYKTKDLVTLVQSTGERPKGNFAKARLVLKGFMQRFGIDYDAIFAPTGKNVILRWLLCMMLIFSLTCGHLDVNTAFLYASLRKPVYMQAPPGYPIPEGKCLKVVKAFYGLKQAPREWNLTLTEFILSLGFVVSLLDSCLFYRTNPNSRCPSFIYVYVDDILIFCLTKTEVDETVIKFKERFNCKYLGKLSRFLGINVHITENTVTLEQGYYAKKIVETHQEWIAPLWDKPRKMALPPDTVDRLEDLSQPNIGDMWYEWWDTFPYQTIVGSLLYLAINSRPDLMYAVCLLARYSIKKSAQACYILCHVLSYVSGTYDTGITYSKKYSTADDPYGYLAYSDADWAGCRTFRRSTAGHLLFMLGAPYVWYSKLLATIAGSSMESEYMSAYHCGQEIVFLYNLHKEVGLPLTKPVVMLMDAKAAIDAIANPVFHARTKHIATKFHWLRQYQASTGGSVIEIVHVPTKEMLADILTKPVSYKIWCDIIPSILSHVNASEAKGEVSVVTFISQGDDGSSQVVLRSFSR